ncbi:hypothetical protein [Kineococcus sp. SYSU DK003]|uniref:hypothetical protein n=1 Tax=Kineococcus sp. SYSU DK003 TaxID=3383124 RepID=UPI003D7DD176
MNVIEATARPSGTGAALDDELDRLLGAVTVPSVQRPQRRPVIAANPLCLCWPDDGE